ncbi:MAG: hypothetical protein JW839_02395 [Candidatus Lokiarchaeota archaeon]|nr:hypothetical protein [Candidatus Lokiarchaeota archaeon]
MHDAFSFKRFVHKSVGYNLLMREIDKDVQVRHNCYAFSSWLSDIAKGRIPEAIFQDDGVHRASRMKFKRIPKATMNNLMDELVGTGALIKDPPSWREMRASIQSITGAKPSHEVMLNHIFRENRSIVAKELPVWRDDKTLTGHLDLLALRTLDTARLEITVLDYKPEGEAEFFKSMPQVSCYATMIEERLRASVNVQVRCIIFDKCTAWSFSPSIMKEIHDRLPRDAGREALK